MTSTFAIAREVIAEALARSHNTPVSRSFEYEGEAEALMVLLQERGVMATGGKQDHSKDDLDSIASLRNLQVRVHVANGPDAELDEHVTHWLNTNCFERAEFPIDCLPRIAVSSNLDALSGLIRRIFPNVSQTIHLPASEDRRAWAELVQTGISYETNGVSGLHSASGKTAPLALLGAFLSLLIALTQCGTGINFGE